MLFTGAVSLASLVLVPLDGLRKGRVQGLKKGLLELVRGGRGVVALVLQEGERLVGVPVAVMEGEEEFSLV